MSVDEKVDFGDEPTEKVEDKEVEDKEVEEKTKKPGDVPYSRFSEVNSDKKRAQERVKELEAQIGTKEEKDEIVDFKKQKLILHKQYQKALIDNDEDKASELYVKMDAIDDRITDFKAERMGSAATEKAVSNVRYDTLLVKLEDDNPELNPGDKKSFDQEKANEVGMLLKGFQSQGMDAAKALQKAVNYVFPQNSEKKNVSPLREDRNKETREKNAKTNKELPPDLDGLGKDSTKKGEFNIMTTTDDEYDKLSEDEKAIARGDKV